MDSTHPLMHPTDHPQSSSLSEADSLSDSDWLDISSNRESDDNDSVSSECRASDHDEIDYGPLSRRSSVSIGSSRDGEVEAWEGLADDSSDEEIPQDDLIGITIDPTLPPALPNTTALQSDHLSLHRDLLEEERVKAALDQSMTGTLSGSRSSSLGGHVPTAQNSIRDLRLSFPDPLMSSQDELHSSYEAPSSFETVAESNVALSRTGTEDVLDPGPNITPAILSITVSNYYLPEAAELEIVLYGTSVPTKWSIVDTIIDKAAIGAGLILTPSLKISEQHSCFLRISGENEAVAAFPKTIAVVDRTIEGGLSYTPKKPTHSQGSNPSLAIIFLPSATFAFNSHSSYLPVFVPSTKRPAIWDRENAKRLWGVVKRNIGRNALFDIHQGPDSILEHDALARIEASHVHNAFQRLMNRAADNVDHTELPYLDVPKRSQSAKDRDSFHFRIGVTGSLLAIVAILFARVYVIDMNQTPTPASRTPPSNTVRSRMFPIANKSSSPVPPNSVAVTPSSLKDFALAVFNPVPSSSPFSSAPLTVGRPTGDANLEQKQERIHCKALSWSERVKTSKDLILTGQSSLSSKSQTKKASSQTTVKGKTTHAKEPPSALSIRLIDSLSQILDVKALTEVVRHDMKELSDALDELMITIGKQTTAIMKESQGNSKILRERLQKRHNKAKVRARQLRDMGGQLGGQLMSYVGSEIKSRAGQARSKAREMAETLVNSDAWTAHKKRVLEHRKRMQACGSEKEKRREIRRARRHARRHKEGKREKGFLFI